MFISCLHSKIYGQNHHSNKEEVEDVSCLHSKIYGQNHHMSPTTPPLTLINYPSSPNI